MTNTITGRVAEFVDRDNTAVAGHSSPFGKAVEFDPVIKTAHWLTLFLIIAVFSTAALADGVPAGWKPAIVQLHRSLGLSIWLVTVLRLLWRQFACFPDWPAKMSGPMRKAVHALEYLLYGLLLLQPLIGLLHTNAHGHKANLFFLVRLPSQIGRDARLSHLLIQAHGIVANALLIVIALHALWAILYHLTGGERTLNRMVPRR
jgi:cytochrome b561